MAVDDNECENVPVADVRSFIVGPAGSKVIIIT